MAVGWNVWQLVGLCEVQCCCVRMVVPKNVCTHVQKCTDYGSWYIGISLQHVALPASNACNY